MIFIFTALTVLSPLAMASTSRPNCNSILARMERAHATDSGWIKTESHIALKKILQNISPSDGKPGSVIAAKTREKPNYYYHWVRDAGLTIDALMGRYKRATTSHERELLKKKVMDYVDFSEFIQKQNALTGLGEPKFNVDGSTFNDPWGRPQNDSPAIRAISIMSWLKILKEENSLNQQYTKRLYNSAPQANSVIKRDLDYVADHWKDPSYDLWEEVKADHFYTRMVQRKALRLGEKFARSMGDEKSAVHYSEQATLIEKDMDSFWDEKKGYYVATKNYVAGLDYKKSGIDIAIVLGLLHADLEDGFMSFNDPKIQATMKKIISTFNQLYPINKRAEIPGVAIGRYPEDLYGGAHFEKGNPWPLCTLAIAEAYFRAAEEMTMKGNKSKALELVAQGDQFVARVEYHKNPDGSLNEQMDRETGYMTSVEDLTWNYAAILTTLYARERVLK